MCDLTQKIGRSRGIKMSQCNVWRPRRSTRYSTDRGCFIFECDVISMKECGELLFSMSFCWWPLTPQPSLLPCIVLEPQICRPGLSQPEPPWQVKPWVLLLLTSLSGCSPQSAAVQADSLLWEEWWWFLLWLALTVHPHGTGGSLLFGYQIVNVGGEIDLGSNPGSDHFRSLYPLRKRI